MQEIFEIDLLGNAGATIKKIISFSKTSEEFLDMDPPLSLDTYEILVEYHSGFKERLTFQNGYETITEHSCFSDATVYKRKIGV